VDAEDGDKGGGIVFEEAEEGELDVDNI
jgi:hypothetical protein